jgi:hypothetical protein
MGGGIVMLYLGIVFFQGLPSNASPLQQYSVLIVLEGAGAVLLSLGTLRVVAETRFKIEARRKPRIARNEESAGWVKDFDMVFPALRMPSLT